MLDKNEDGHIKNIDLDEQKSSTSEDEINQNFIGNDAEDEQDLKEDEGDIRFDDFEEDSEEEIRTGNDQNKDALIETKQEKQGARFLSLYIL